MREERTIGMALMMLLVLAPSAIAWTVSGTVYFTVNSTAIAVGGVPVNLTEADSTFIAQTTTAADGTYSFTTAAAPPPPKLLTAFVQSQSKIVTKPTSPLGSDQVINLTFAFSCPDSDGDSYYASWCGGTDCNDTEITLFSQITGYADSDGDTYTSGSGSSFCTNGTLPSGYLAAQNPEDCNDANAAVHPGASEINCNNVDDDCSAGDFCVVKDDNDRPHSHSSGGYVYNPPLEEEKCKENWVCGSWKPAECPSSGEQTRTCEDLNDCGSEDKIPSETRSCNYVAPEPEQPPSENESINGITGAVVGTDKNSRLWPILGIILIIGGLIGIAGLIHYIRKK